MIKKKEKVASLRSFALVFVIIIIFVAMSFASPVFLTSKNLINIVRQISINGIIAVGMTFVILTGGIDLSVGSVVAITSVICGYLLQNGSNWLVACVVALGIALVFGAFNGFMIAYVGFQPFIATLATVTMGSGIALAFSDGKPFTITNETFLKIGQGYVGPIPIPVILLVIIVAIGLIILKTTTFGRYVFAIGGNKSAAKLSGVRTRRIELMVYMLSSVCAAVVGLILSARISSGQPTAGEGYELDAIAATAIGGTSMSGGLGSLTGTVFGFVILGLMTNSMNLLNINSFYQQIAKGILIILAVFLDMTSKGKKQ
ncbi:MAG: ABC transporter permease [Hespellia sp.]|nr:ABC transporter permease [Hespellia sp.]